MTAIQAWNMAAVGVAVLSLVAIFDVLILSDERFKRGNKLIWLIVVIALGPLGTILYGTLGRGRKRHRPEPA